MRRNFARVSRSLSFTVIGVLLFGSPSKGQEESFYKGKTLRVIAGTTAGALYDQWARVIAAHIVKHIPGNPQVIVQNMPGAGHQIAAGRSSQLCTWISSSGARRSSSTGENSSSSARP